MLMTILGAILIGFIAGLIARALHPGNDKASFLVTTALGIIGSLLATFGGQLLGLYREGESAGFIASVIGALIVLTLYNFMRRKSV